MKKDQFLQNYLSLQQCIVQKDFAELNEHDLKQIEQLKDQAIQIYHHIVKSREIGIEYLVVAFSYFSVGTSESMTEAQYLILRVSYFFYEIYQALAQLAKSNAKQKEICDLLRYISKPMLESEQDPILYPKSKALLVLCLEFILKYVVLDKTTYLKWDEHIKGNVIQHPKIFSYLHALTIIFKRLSQQKIVHRARKTRQRSKDWPSKKQLKRYRRKKQAQDVLPDYPAKISTVDDWDFDEVGDLEYIKTSTFIHSTESTTTRFNPILQQQTEYLLRHRQRRLQPFVTNVHYMSDDVIRHLVYILNLELQNNHHNDAALAAACLLSLTTGLSPVDLLEYEQLIEEGVLIYNDNMKKPEYSLRLYLDITQQKIEILRPYQLNHTVSHDLHLSSSWFNYLGFHTCRELITINDINRYLKKCTHQQHIGSITVEKLQAQLYFHIFHQTFNEYIAHVLSNKDSHHDLPSSFYNGVAKTSLNEQYLIYLNTFLVSDASEDLKNIQQQFERYAPPKNLRFGSQLVLTPSFVTDFFTQLRQVCQDKMQSHQHVITQLNAYSLWMWHIYLLCLTARPKENLLGELSDYDLELNLLYVNDKKNSRSRKDGRFIPLSKFFMQAFRRYLHFLQGVATDYADLFKFVFKKRITVKDLFGRVIIYPKELPVTARDWKSKKIKIVVLDRSWINNALFQHLSYKLYNNWLRHFDMNMLMEQGVAFNVIQSLYGHDQFDQELFYRYSSASLHQYMLSVTQGIDRMIKELNIQHLS